MFKLVIADDEGKQTVVPLVRDEITIGRKEGNTIRLTERNVSRRHARLMKANGRFVIEDLQSYNGVTVNGQRVEGDTPLDPGDQIQIGDYQLALQTDGEGRTLVDHPAPSVADAATAMIAAPGPPARLVMITPPAPGAEFALTQDRVRIGRAEDLEIFVNHRSISREHAEVQKEPDGGLRLIDLGSANGVRVNSEDVQNALLSPGDVVELGQVRFRFVGAGEHYAFDADRTVQMDAVSLGAQGSNRAPLFIGVAIVAVAIVAGITVAVWGGDDEPSARPLVAEADQGSDPGAEGAAGADPYQAALAACRSAVSSNDLVAALSHAQAALEAHPGDAAASQCQAQAQALQDQQQTFTEGVRYLEAGELEQAYFQFDSLPNDSPYRSRPQVREAVQGYAGAQLQAAQTILSADPDEALRIAEFVLNIEGLSPAQRAQASALERSAQERGASEAAPQPTRVARRGRHRGGGSHRSARSAAPPAPDHGGSSAQAASGQGGGTEAASAGQSHPSRGGGVDEQVRQCTMRGDNACVIRLLEGRARSQQQLAMLIEAYRARGQQNQSLRHMRTFVQRFPGSPRARMYQQILSRH